MNILEQIKQPKKEENPMRSKLIFHGDFLAQIKLLIEELECIFNKKIASRYQIEYTSSSNNSFKIKVNDKEKLIFKLINCKLIYRKSDIKFGYIFPEILSDEKGRKTITHKLGKFKIDKHEVVIDAIFEKLLEVIEEY